MKKALLITLMCLFILAVSGFAEMETLNLLTDEEAALPEAPKTPFDIARAINNGPEIKVVMPEVNKEYRVPLKIVVKFIPQKGREVDLSKFKVECLKLFAIDITDRVKPYTTKEGISAQNANIPPGQYKLRLTIGDSDGGITQEIFQLKVLE